MSSAPAAGLLDQRVTFQSRGTADNDLGERTDVWTDVFACWASVQPMRAREQFAAGQPQATFDTRITLRYRANIDSAAMRVMWRGTPLEIVGMPIDVDGGRHTLELMCITGVRDGR